jgi:hypothetical protein
MTTRALAVAALVLMTGGSDLAAAQSARRDTRHPPTRIIGQTTVVGESDPTLWRTVLDLLPSRPRRIEVLDLDSLSGRARQKLRGLDAFVLSGETTIVVIRQGATLRQAEFGDALDRLMLASLVWHELAHVNGLDERAALEQEEALWRRFISTGQVDGGVGMTYIARLREVSAATTSQSKVQVGGRPPC